MDPLKLAFVSTLTFLAVTGQQLYMFPKSQLWYAVKGG